jgi:hypothetical protein
LVSLDTLINDARSRTPKISKISSWMCTVHIQSCNLNFYTTLCDPLFALRWVNCYGRADVQSHTSKWRGGNVTSTETVRQVTQCWWTTSNVNVRHKHKGTFSPNTQLHTTRKMCEAQKCLEFSRPLWTFEAHNHYCYSHLLRLHKEQLNMHQFCDCSYLVVHLSILIMYVRWKSYGTCVCQQLASGLAQYRNLNSANMATAVSPVFLQMCDTVSWVRVKKWKYSTFITDNSTVFHLR